MKQIGFKGKAWKINNSKVVTIPEAIADLMEEKEYYFLIKEGEKNGESKGN
jgi:hypothetical protein